MSTKESATLVLHNEGEYSFVLFSGCMDCTVRFYGENDNKENWKRFIDNLKNGKKDTLTFESCNGDVEIFSDKMNRVNFSIGKHGENGGELSVSLPVSECIGMFEEYAAIMTE